MNMRFRLEIDGMSGTGAVEAVLPEARIARTSGKRAVTRYGPLIVRRGLTASRDWYDWWDDARRSKAAKKRNVRIMVLDEHGDDAIGWTFVGATPVGYHVSSLNAMIHAVLIETLELEVGDFRAGDHGSVTVPAR